MKRTHSSVTLFLLLYLAAGIVWTPIILALWPFFGVFDILTFNVSSVVRGSIELLLFACTIALPLLLHRKNKKAIPLKEKILRWIDLAAKDLLR